VMHRGPPAWQRRRQWRWGRRPAWPLLYQRSARALLVLLHQLADLHQRLRLQLVHALRWKWPAMTWPILRIRCWASRGRRP